MRLISNSDTKRAVCVTIDRRENFVLVRQKNPMKIFPYIANTLIMFE